MEGVKNANLVVRSLTQTLILKPNFDDDDQWQTWLIMRDLKATTTTTSCWIKH